MSKSHEKFFPDIKLIFITNLSRQSRGLHYVVVIKLIF